MTDSLAKARTRVATKGSAPFWAVFFESIVRGTTAAVVLILVMILTIVAREGAPRLIGIETRYAQILIRPTDAPGSGLPGNVLVTSNASRLVASWQDEAALPAGPAAANHLPPVGGSMTFGELQLNATREGLEAALGSSKGAAVRGQHLTIDGPALTLHDRSLWTYNLDFLLDAPRDGMTSGGIFPALFGTLFVVLFMILLALPLGVFAAVYLVEYTAGGVTSRLIRAAVNNLAGVPSIVFGLFGLGFFVLFIGRHLDYYALGIPRTDAEQQAFETRVEPLREEARKQAGALATEKGLKGPERIKFVREYVQENTPQIRRRVFGQGAMFWASATLAILVLPVIIVATEESLRAVPASLREAAYGLGATKWQVISTVVLPQARPGILTGAILAVARGAGELAPILFVGVTFFAPTLPLTEPINFYFFEMPVVNPFTQFMHLNYHIYTMATQNTDPVGTRAIQFGTTMVLVTLTFLINLAAIILRRRLNKSTLR
jgi:phosphate transport system permease protein